MTRFAIVAVVALAATAHPDTAARPGTFDHQYGAYAALLDRHIVGDRVDYKRLVANRAELDRVVAAFSVVSPDDERSWPPSDRLAFWINAYNALTLQAIVNHYPIAGRWLSPYPKNSIRQIGGVWTRLTWQAAGRVVTLDQIENEILRRDFQEPRIHFAINCASVGCPPLAAVPYRGRVVDDQLDDAARRFLASPRGLQAGAGGVRLSEIFKWFGDDFVPRFSPAGSPDRRATDRAVLAVVEKYGPAPAAQLVRERPNLRIAFLDYDWSLNDVAAERP